MACGVGGELATGVVSGLARQHCTALQADGEERRDRKRQKFEVASHII